MTLYLCPWCFNRCYYQFTFGQPRESTSNEKCQCILPGCLHGQEYVPYKWAMPT